jgi:peptidoglycan/LPS O-acetylase OafA/YrhL
MVDNTSGHGYLPALDGLRALAVGAVVAYHLGLPWAPGGFLGVDLFFVLSGFLITGILTAERERRGAVDLGRFYSRRARRLLPALLVLLVVVSVWVGVAGGDVDRVGFRGDVWAALGYVANWRFVFSHQGYFAQFSAPSPVRHLWSLAIEEQYYLVWPLVLAGLLGVARGSRRVAAGATLALAAASAMAMAALFHPGHDPSRVYYGTDTRAFELLVGSGLALVARHRDGVARRLVPLAGMAGLAGLGWMVVVVRDSSEWMYRGGFVAASLLAAAAVWAASTAQPMFLGAALSWRPLGWIGRISYGLYLWHWPVIDLLTRPSTGLTTNELRLVQTATALGAATVSFYLIERPIRTGRLPGWRAAIAVPLAVTSTAAALLWATVEPGLALPSRPVTVSFAASRPVVSSTTTTTVAASRVPPPLGLGVALPAGPPQPMRVLVVGDSVMYDAAPAIKAALESTGAVHVDVEAALGFGLTRTTPYPWRSVWPRLVAADRPALVIALFGGWDGPQAVARGPEWYGGLVDDARRLLTSGGAQLLWLAYPRNEPPDIPGRPPTDQVVNERQRQAVNNAFGLSALGHSGQVAFLDLDAAITPEGSFTAFLPNALGVAERIRKHDNIHFCPAGAERVGSWVFEAVAAAYALPPPAPAWPVGTWRADRRYNSPPGACN